MSRFTVKPSYVDGAITMWIVVDRLDHCYAGAFDREALAISMASRLSRDWEARVAREWATARQTGEVTW
jgi:hypothetical protein